MKRLLVVGALLGALVPGSALAQSCTTTNYVPHVYNSTCSGGGDLVDALVLLYALQAEQRMPTAAPVDPGVTINMYDGTTRYLARGTFVRIGQAPAIYWVYGGQLHAFQTWPQFLADGGASDLSNVIWFSSLTDNGGLYGAVVS